MLIVLTFSILMPAACEGTQPAEAVSVEHTQTTLLTGTVSETAVHKYVTDKEGPKIAIVGGIHGDELAGWTAGLELVDMLGEDTAGICGEILLIPQANILADSLQDRYPGRTTAVGGIGTVSGVQYSDLNRSFPDGRASNATEATISISDAIRLEIEAFEPDYVIDLHESLHSWARMEQTTQTSTSLGDSLIYKNQPLFMDDLIYYYNKVYRQDGETEFTSNPTSTKGSFNYYFSNLYPQAVVFTVETNREYVTGQGDTALLDTRVRQQLNILEAMFDLVWERVDTSGVF